MPSEVGFASGLEMILLGKSVHEKQEDFQKSSFVEKLDPELVNGLSWKQFSAEDEVNFCDGSCRRNSR